MTDIAAFHIATIRAGEIDEHSDNDALFVVSHDQKRYYYDLSGMNVSKEEFEAFVNSAWDRDDAVADEWVGGVYRVILD